MDGTTWSDTVKLIIIMVTVLIIIGRLNGAILLTDRLINSRSEYVLSWSLRSMPSKIQPIYDPPKVGTVVAFFISKGGSSTFLPKIRR